MPVDLFGQPADYRALEPIAAREGLKMLCDTAQGFRRARWTAGAPAQSAMRRQPVSSRPSRSAVTAMAAPVSPMMTGSKDLLRSIRMHGQGTRPI